jgi:4-amino-4-deoxy-L-arabinose transferase-like glycosyltransferase
LENKQTQAMNDAAAGSRSYIRGLCCSPLAMVAVALAIRLAVMGFVYTSQLDPGQDHWAFGCETGRVARSIVTGQGFSSPYTQPTGPTALLPPTYPLLLAGIFKLFGIYSAASALAILSLNNLFSSLTCLPLFFIARRVFGPQVAIWAGWGWAIFPYSIMLSNLWIWETTLTTLLMTLIVLATFYIERSKSIVAWILFGLLWGVTALTSPAVLSTLPFLGAWAVYRHWQRGSKCIGVAGVASLVFLATVAPWAWRCSMTYGRFVALRSNFGLEILVGNSEDTSNPFNWGVLPASGGKNNSFELTKLIRIGEPAYLAEKNRDAWDLIEQHPARFAGLTLRRVLYTWTSYWDNSRHPWLDDSGLPNILMYSLISFLAWTGLVRAIRDGLDGVFPLAFVVVCFPLIYYITHPEIRFRHPIDPIIVILFVNGVMSLRGQEQESPGAEPMAIAKNLEPAADSVPT